MSPGHWEILIIAVILLFLFWPYLVRVVRLLMKLRGEDGEEEETLGRARRRKRVDSSRRMLNRCPHCDGKLPEDAEFCPRCGRRVGIVDV